MEYYINGFQDYLQTLCTHHKLVAHDTAQGGQKSFVRFCSHDELQQQLNNPGAHLVIVTRYYGKSIFDTDDEAMKQFIEIRFATNAQKPLDGDFTGAITAATATALQIMFDFIARMRQDFMQDDCGPLRGIELENCSWFEIPEQPFLENHFGWDLSIPFRSQFPAHNPDVWNA